ncbi:Chromosome transmission fidelity protein 8 [Pleurotus pulmonarius]
MIIPVTLSTSPGAKLPAGLAKISHDEVVLIELQGALEVETTKPGERDGKVVGRLTIDEVTSKPKLMIGHHLLEGKIATLAKPLAVIHRARHPQETSPDAMDCDQNIDQGQMGAEFDDDVETGRTGNHQWEIIAVVKKKILFSNRPMPIVKLRG